MEVDAVDEPVEVLLVDVADVLRHRRAQVLVELVVGPLLAGVPDDAQIFEPFAPFERQQCREQEARGEIAGGAEHDERRTSHARSVRATMPGMTLRLGINLGYQDWANGLPQAVSLVQRAEALGFHSAWTAEAYGTDAITPLTWLMAHTERMEFGPAIMQMPARTPAMTAMTAATLDGMSGGRFRLGLGLSGPQVVEGWHGQPYGKPLVKTREYVEIVREILKREKPLEHHGEHYDIPYTGPGATGLGKPLKIIVHPRRADIPIYLAAIGPKNVELTAEIADGWLPIFFSPYRVKEAFGGALDAGFARAGGGKSFDGFDIAPTVTVIVGDDPEQLANFIRPMVALYVGGMGARGRNFYNDLACRYGFEAAAKEVQDLYLDGKKQEAAAAIPFEMIDEVALLGPKERIRDRLEPWREAGVTTMILGAQQPEALEVMAELIV